MSRRRMVIGIVTIMVIDVKGASNVINIGLFPIIFNSDIPVRPYPLPTYPPTPHPYPSPTLPPSPSPSPVPTLKQYLPILFDSILGNLFDK